MSTTFSKIKFSPLIHMNKQSMLCHIQLDIWNLSLKVRMENRT